MITVDQQVDTQVEGRTRPALRGEVGTEAVGRRARLWLRPARRPPGVEHLHAAPLRQAGVLAHLVISTPSSQWAVFARS